MMWKQAWNAPGGWGNNIDVTDFSQLQIEQLVRTAEGHAAYSTYMRLLAEAVVSYADLDPPAHDTCIPSADKPKINQCKPPEKH